MNPVIGAKTTEEHEHEGARPTLAEVARMAGVNKSTASRALRGDVGIARETRERIQQLAAQINYVPNISARRLNNVRTNVLAFAPHALNTNAGDADPFLVELLAQITKEAARHHYDILLCHPDEDATELEMYKRVVRGRYADGFILSDLRSDDPRLEYLIANDFPHVLFGRSDQDVQQARTYPYPWVEVDNHAGAQLAVEHLLSLGHRRIAFIGGGGVSHCEIDRRVGYRDALEEAGITYDPAFFMGNGMSQEDGYLLTRQLLSQPDPPTAIFAFSDVVAVGAMRAAQAAGRSVGRQFSVIGFDGLKLGTYLTPQLTTLRQPIEYVGFKLVQLLIGALNGEPLPEKHLMLQPELIVRASTQGD